MRCRRREAEKHNRAGRELFKWKLKAETDINVSKKLFEKGSNVTVETKLDSDRMKVESRSKPGSKYVFLLM